jgi:hypothetical protein
MVTRLFSGAFDVIRQFVCGLHGHDALLHFETGRLSMRCTTCGHETPGWDLKAAAPRPAAQSTTRVLRLPLVRERRAA